MISNFRYSTTLSVSRNIRPYDKEKNCFNPVRSKDDALVHAIADSLKAHGIASIRFDFNGHGESYGEQWQMTVQREIEDEDHMYTNHENRPAAMVAEYLERELK